MHFMREICEYFMYVEYFYQGCVCMTDIDKFIYNWENIRKSGKKKYIIIKGILKYSSISLILMITLKYCFNIKFVNSYMNSGRFEFIICGIIIPTITYFVRMKMWKCNNDKYTKIMLSKIIESRESIIIIK